MKKYLLNILMFVSLVSASLIFIIPTEELTNAHENNNNVLLANNRNSLDICVESFVPEITSEFVKESVSSILKERLVKNDMWDQLYSHTPFNVVNGCDIAPLLLQEDAKHPVYFSNGTNRIVEVPSKNRVAVYIVPSETIKKHFGEELSRISPEEMLCEGHQCYEVTTGVYVSKDEIKLVEMLYDDLKRSLALKAPYDVLQLDHHSDGRMGE